MRKFILTQKIYITRKFMYKLAERYGYTHPTVVNYSQKLDLLLNRYQNI